MALSAQLAWTVHLTTGVAANGGGFRHGAPGIDYSLSDSPGLSLTDLACANVTTVTSATGGFTAQMVGNVLHITAGTNFTAGFYEIITVNSSTSIVLDRNPTTGASATVGVGRVGGAILTVGALNGIAVAGNVILVDAASDTGLAAMRTLWRELTGEFDTTVITDAVVDVYLNRGLEWLNQATEYHQTTGTGGVTLVAGTQEYALDVAVMRIKWVQLAGQELTPGNIEEWRNRGEAWRQEVGMPEEWAVEGNRIIFRPTPHAAAVALASTPVMRYVSTPPDISVFGPEQMQSQDRRLPVFYGAHLYSACEGGTALSLQRAQDLLERSREEGVFSQRDAQSKESMR